MEKATDRIKLLDTTLRDGGLGLEDAFINGISEKHYSKSSIKKTIQLLKNSGIDVIELGSIEISENDKTRFCIYQDIESISSLIPKDYKQGQLFAALYRGPDTPIELIPFWREGLCQCVRVIIRYSELKKSLDFCESLSQKGYKVFVQPMLTMRYTNEEIDYLIERSNKMKAYALYFVDSYGYMSRDDVMRFYNIYDSKLDPQIRIGFHAHNNMNLALSNVLDFLNKNSQRSIIVDSCITGMGQGAGNLQTELIVPVLNQKYEKNYDYDSILDGCELIERFLNFQLWGYSVTRLLPAIHKVAYKYAISMRHTYKMSYKEINRVLENIPEEYRHRYTPDNLKKIISLNNK